MAAAPAGVGGGDHDLPIEEVGALLASFSGDPAAALPPMPEAEAGTTSGEPVGGRECPVEGLGEIEKFLMEGEGEAALEAGVDGFLDGVLVGEGDGSPTPMGGRSMDGVSAGEREEVVGVDGNDDGPDIKKKRRQMRNRDSAMKSRERKKLYVKDLEMKSKYLEAECCRLSYALQCCAAENMALRRCLLKDRPVGAPAVMQESAVLTETLPLVSLLWLVSIMCLFLMPGVPNGIRVVPSSSGRDLVKMARVASNSVKMTRTATNGDAHGSLELLRHGRRCKGRRTRMKFPVPSFEAPAC